MPFPLPIVTLDDFDRVDAVNLGANWTIATDYSALPIVSNTAGYDVLPALETWNVTSFAANQRAWVTMADTLGTIGESAALVFRCPTTAAADGYRVNLTQTGATIEAHCYRINTGEEIGVLIDLGIAAFTIGDFVGIDVDNNLFTLYYGASGLLANPVGTWTDAGIDAAGYIGVGIGRTMAVWAGTVNLGIYHTKTFPDTLSILQPIWAADNAGLPDMSLASKTLLRFGADYSDQTTQMLVLQDTTPAPDDHTIYTRSAGGAWASALTEVQATIVAGVGGRLVFKDAVYDTVTSTLYAVYGTTTGNGPMYLLKSINNGASWSLVSATASTYFYLGRIYARGSEIAVAGGFSIGGPSYLRYSTNAGVTFNISPTLGGSAWSAYPFVLAGGKLFVNGNGVNGPDLLDVDKVTLALTVLFPGDDLGPQNADALWEDQTNMLHQRIIDNSRLWVTTDAWGTLVNPAPPAIVPTMERQFAPVTGEPNFIFYAQSFPVAGFPHVLYITASEGGLLVPRSGNDPLNPPYTDSIPYVCGGLCNGGLVVQ